MILKPQVQGFPVAEETLPNSMKLGTFSRKTTHFHTFGLLHGYRDHPGISDTFDKDWDLFTDEDIAEVEKAAKDWKRVKPARD